MTLTGKGGVGKTMLASVNVNVLSLDQAGHRMLRVSTDPASNMDELLDVPLKKSPTAEAIVAGLWALNSRATANRPFMSCITRVDEHHRMRTRSLDRVPSLLARVKGHKSHPYRQSGAGRRAARIRTYCSSCRLDDVRDSPD